MENSRAIVLMTLAMATFAIGDSMVKISSGNMSIAQVLIFMSLPGVIVFAALAHRSGQPPVSRDFLAKPVVLRNVIEGISATCMVTALATAPLGLVISILQAVPLFVTLGAALVLKEKVGPRRWAAVIVGFCGVLLMLRPDASGISFGAINAVFASIVLAARDYLYYPLP